jgi:tetratricopeptide (TPR) repeat protein
MRRLISLLALGAVCLRCQTAKAERPVNEEPMYGGTNLSSRVLAANQKLTDWAIREFGDLHAASKDATQRGWKAYYQGDLDTAIKRFNQGWLFDKENPDVYWGFGLVIGQRASKTNPEMNLKESIRFLQMATEKDPNNGRIMGDLAFSHTILGYYYQSEKKYMVLAEQHFRNAGELFPKAFRADPKYPPTVANWSVFCFYTGDFPEARNKADQAMAMGYEFEPEYIYGLDRKMKQRTSRSTVPATAGQ